MYAQRFAADLFGIDACGISQPVVSVDNIELLRPRHHTGDDRVVVDLVVEIGGIAARKVHASQIVDVHIVEVGIDMVTEVVVFFRAHQVADALFDVVVVDISPCDGHTVHGHDVRKGVILIAPGLRQAEGDVDIALSVQSFRDTEIGSCQTAVNMRRILPSKH